ncbi:uncharacterized protein TRIADDRAFT_30078 [Trichoplax adhaerens]|uniref:DNA polymerase epsilon catalytic subunit n=1 Tax=Trichoplax adhaerens TaxID=10228 RepID=B3S6C7_TRIAD|nr:hypothetical protein TRIADDRAFT_30078 [Trichoplax adhaerens]EDV21734.1 hypothetical protein TRIADDRAFT_30078 [Trichoplax adhaerens]|eukprot:XP_002115882.1 hypothetical protein TRIADDRAFT_30078 [Trichoplax adhaerens]
MRLSFNILLFIARENVVVGKRKYLEDIDKLDTKFGFEQCKDNRERLGWLINMHSTELIDDNERIFSAVDYYFVEEDGSRFKVTMPYKPYFYVAVKKDTEAEVASYLLKRFSGVLTTVDIISKEELNLPNHLAGITQKYLKLSFNTVTDFLTVRKVVQPAIVKNIEREKTHEADMLLTRYIPKFTFSITFDSGNHMERMHSDAIDNLIDIREYDVPYHVRLAIDLDIRVGYWYDVKNRGELPPLITRRDDLLDRPDPLVLAFDIETTKLPLRFPDSSSDAIMMISYMADGQGYLIINREIVSEDIDDFEYTPKPEYEGSFIIFNEPDEVNLLNRFFQHIIELKPTIYATYNGDAFDWPFIEARAAFHDINMSEEIGFSKDNQDEYKSRYACHMDCYRWVKRDSYLPVGSHNLKAVTKAKLRYNPIELDPEEMCRMASEQPQILANYSVSDAVATYYLYMKYVHPFVFSLCTIIPMKPDEVLRKGSGTLCETLLMVQAYQANIIFPNKQETILTKFTDEGHLLEEETYVGGHVEAIESGVFRSDIPCKFKLVPAAFDKLTNNIRATMRHAIEVEEKVPMDSVTNIEEVYEDIAEKLQALKNTPSRLENPLIYHLDVGAMYPNIILTNRLQPSAIVDEATCAACDFNKPGANCQRKMEWTWRGQFMPASRSEYHAIRQQLESEMIPGKSSNEENKAFYQLSRVEQASIEKKRLADYCRRVYRKVHLTNTGPRTSTVCQRENSFYVDTVRAFRDRRYEYKRALKKWKREVSTATSKGDPGEIKSAKSKEILYDSLQLAHKCILNSFYGYVMRKGARWYSMEMAGIVCYTGASIITRAREIVEQIGRPLELDTDGIWCALPASFPENYVIRTNNPQRPSVIISYPNAILNLMVKDEFTNHQYNELVDSTKLRYTFRSENSIFFEVDGPYKAMILPASKEEGKKLKKRYAVFNEDGSLAELKGFEVKRRGELQLIKIFQSSVFEAFLLGSSLEECYKSVSKIADYWLDILHSKAINLPDSELFDLISENRNMARSLEEYGNQKSSSISTAKRLAEFLGDQMVRDKGLSCRFIISRKPEGAPVTERAIPLAIFQTERSVKHHYLRKWLKSPSLKDFDIRSILDWDYYIERLSSAIQKIITIPAALQGISNPIPRVQHPNWLHKRLLEKNDMYKQSRISEIFKKEPKKSDDRQTINTEEKINNPVIDIEDLSSGKSFKKTSITSTVKKFFRKTTNIKDSSKSDLEDLSLPWKDALGIPPALNRDEEQFGDWLRFQKRKWNYQLKQKKKRRQTRSDSGSLELEERWDMSAMMRKQANILLNSIWQIVQIAETDVMGRFRLWVLIGIEMYSLYLRVPRIFYVNLKRPKQGESVVWRKVNRQLPHSSQVYNLYEYSVPEEIFAERSGELSAELSSPDVEGVYEAQVPLMFRALVRLGCLCKVNKKAYLSEASKDITEFDLRHLEFKTLAEHSYLESGNLKYIYLYHSHHGSRAVFGLFSPINSEAHVFLIDTVRTNQINNLSNIYQSEWGAKYVFSNYVTLPPEKYSFQLHIETDMRRVYRTLIRSLISYKEMRYGPTILLIQSPTDYIKLATYIPAINDFPVASVSSNDSDNRYPILDWQRHAVRRMIQHHLNIEIWLENRLDHARYAHIPLGNMPADVPLFVNDLFFARYLAKNNHLIWASRTPRPDLGGKEDDDSSIVSEELPSIELNNPGCYPSVSAEISMHGLAVSSVLQSLRLGDFETDLTFDAAPQASLDDIVITNGNPGTELSSYDEMTLCSSTFRIMKIMVHSWLHEVSSYENHYADLQLMHFYRWLKSPLALLYDPAMYRIVRFLMEKLFAQLLAEFKRLGSTIIHGSFSKIIICTKKRRVNDARSYLEFILQSIASRDMFQSIELRFSMCWEYLMWMDHANFGGIRSKADVFEFDQNCDESDSISDENNEENELRVEMNWNICKYLPTLASCQDFFQIIIAGFVHAMYKKQCDITPGNTPVKRYVGSQSQSTSSSVVTFAQQYIEKELTQQLFSLTQKIQKMLPYGNAEKDTTDYFPDLPGSHLVLRNPALQFVKAVCKVLSLDSRIQNRVNKLRRDLLRLIGVGEFSQDAIFQNPCISYVIPEVICTFCNSCTDLDICRDIPVIQDDVPYWRCLNCENNYETEMIEQHLISVIKRQAVSYLVQDLKCLKCRQVKEDDMSTHCSCAGDYLTTISTDSVLSKLRIFANLARHYNLAQLQETVDYIIDSNPTFKFVIDNIC